MSDMTPPERVKVVFAPNGNIRLFTTGDIPASLAEFPVYEYVLASALEASEARAAAAERALDALRAAQQWQPIETAPKDGTPIIGGIFNAPWADSHMNGSVVKAWWQPEFEAFISGAREMVLANGYTFEDGSTRQMHSPEIQPVTHWQPLPAPPSAIAEARP